MTRPATSPAAPSADVTTVNAPLTTGRPALAVAPPGPPPVLLTVAEAAELLRIDPYTVRRYVNRGELPAYRIGRELRIDPAELQAYLQGRRA